MRDLYKLLVVGVLAASVHASDWEHEEGDQVHVEGPHSARETPEPGYPSVPAPPVYKDVLAGDQGYVAIAPPKAHDVKSGGSPPPPSVVTVTETQCATVTETRQEQCYPVTVTVTTSKPKKKCKQTQQPVPTFYPPSELLKPFTPQCGGKTPCGSQNPYMAPSCPRGGCDSPTTSTVRPPVQTPPSHGCPGGSCSKPTTSAAKNPVYTPPPTCHGGSCSKPTTSTAKNPVYTPPPTCHGGSCSRPTTSTAKNPVYTPSPTCHGGSCASGHSVKSTHHNADKQHAQDELSYQNNMDFSNKYDSDDTGYYYAYIPPQ